MGIGGHSLAPDNIFGDRITVTPEGGFGFSATQRDYRLCWRLTRAGAGPGSLELSMEARRREAANPGLAAGAGTAPERQRHRAVVSCHPSGLLRDDRHTTDFHAARPGTAAGTDGGVRLPRSAPPRRLQRHDPGPACGSGSNMTLPISLKSTATASIGVKAAAAP